jgi:hypothetical protein
MMGNTALENMKTRYFPLSSPGNNVNVGERRWF